MKHVPDNKKLAELEVGDAVSWGQNCGEVIKTTMTQITAKFGQRIERFTKMWGKRVGSGEWSSESHLSGLSKATYDTIREQNLRHNLLRWFQHRTFEQYGTNALREGKEALENADPEEGC